MYFRFHDSGSEGPILSSGVRELEEEDPEIETLVSDFERVRMLPKSTRDQKRKEPWQSGSAFVTVTMWYCVCGPFVGFVSVWKEGIVVCTDNHTSINARQRTLPQATHPVLVAAMLNVANVLRRLRWCGRYPQVCYNLQPRGIRQISRGTRDP
jgi:hypothetical protein